jgi:4-hydroxy-3-polyprenylbenzoate decarboxylase
MAYSCLQSFLQQLEKDGELRRIPEQVSPLVEINRFVQQEVTRPSPMPSQDAKIFDHGREQIGGRALLFENIEGCDFPLAINVYGSYYRTEEALGGDGFEAIATKIASMTTPTPPSSFADLLAMAKKYKPLLTLKPKRRKGNGLCQEIVKLTSNQEVDVTRIPFIQCWPLDGDPRKVGYDYSPEDSGTAGGDGRYITMAGIHTIHAEDRDVNNPPSHNIGMYRVQLLSPTTVAMHWHITHDGAAHWRSWKAVGEPMPIAICIGGESVLPYAATAPLPPGVSELLMAGFLHGKGVEMVRAKTVPLWVPAKSEMVIEGFVSTTCGDIGWEPGDEPLGDGAVFEGPFGDHTGFYSMPDRYPIVDVTAVTHRKNAIFLSTVVGAPPQEDYYLGKATERIMLPLLKVIIPDIIDYHLPKFGTFHNCVFIKMKPEYPLHARKVMSAIWGAGQMAWIKLIVIVNEDVDVHDEHAVLRAVHGIDIHQDITLTRGPVDILDHAAAKLGASGKIGIDATHGDSSTNAIHIITVDKQESGDGSRAIQQAHATKDASTKIIIAVDESVDKDDLGSVFFNFCACVDPSRDTYQFDACIGFDGTTKMAGDARNGYGVRPWPPPVSLD